MGLYAFDGTWNSATLSDSVEPESDTNVARFCEAYDRERTWYVAGPGTRFGEVGRVIGGVTGAGGFERVNEAYKQLCVNFAAGDSIIDIIGFSRGASLALDFANRIHDNGIRRPGTKEVTVDDPRIRFLGLWDVVGSFGVPIGKIFQKVNLGHKLYLPDIVQYCFHAMAMDERRQTFRVTRLLNAYETWFRGVHSDVGGGNGNTRLSSIALRWMLRKALAAGLPVQPAAIDALQAAIDPSAAIKPPKDLVANEYRGFLRNDRFHYTVSERANHNNAPFDSPRETEQTEAQALQLSELHHVDVPQLSADQPAQAAQIAVTEADRYAEVSDAAGQRDQSKAASTPDGAG